MEADRRDAGLVDKAVGEREPVSLPGPLPRAQLHRHRQPAALGRGARHRDRSIGILEERRPGARLADLRDRAAHVEIDQVRPPLGDRGGRGSHHVRVLAEELDRHGAAVAGTLLRVDAQHFGDRLLVAVMDREARHHLGDGEARAVAFRLQADEPVADPRQWREDDAVRDPDTADVE